MIIFMYIKINLNQTRIYFFFTAKKSICRIIIEIDWENIDKIVKKK